jgi:ATP-dependent RNA helicase DHX29
MFSGIAILDGNRARLALPDWKTTLALKLLRQRMRELLARAFRDPGKTPTPQHEKWMDCWQRVFAAAWEYVREKERAKGGE